MTARRQFAAAPHWLNRDCPLLQVLCAFLLFLQLFLGMKFE
jgi:hypothetical protein